MKKAIFHRFCGNAWMLNQRHGKNRNLPPLIMLTDAGRLPDVEHIVPHLPYASIIILRDYLHPERLAYGKKLAAVCRRYGHIFLVSNDPVLATRLKADGLHIPESGHLNLGRGYRPSWLVTTAAHSRTGVLKAVKKGADAVLCSPVFPTQSHPEGKILGRLLFSKMVQGVNIPVYALGGVNAENIKQLKYSNVVGVAAIDAFASLHF